MLSDEATQLQLADMEQSDKNWSVGLTNGSVGLRGMTMHSDRNRVQTDIKLSKLQAKQYCRKD